MTLADVLKPNYPPTNGVREPDFLVICTGSQKEDVETQHRLPVGGLQSFSVRGCLGLRIEVPSSGFWAEGFVMIGFYSDDGV